MASKRVRKPIEPVPALDWPILRFKEGDRVSLIKRVESDSGTVLAASGHRGRITGIETPVYFDGGIVAWGLFVLLDGTNLAVFVAADDVRIVPRRNPPHPTVEKVGSMKKAASKDSHSKRSRNPAKDGAPVPKGEWPWPTSFKVGDRVVLLDDVLTDGGAAIAEAGDAGTVKKIEDPRYRDGVAAWGLHVKMDEPGSGTIVVSQYDAMPEEQYRALAEPRRNPARANPLRWLEDNGFVGIAEWLRTEALADLKPVHAARLAMQDVEYGWRQVGLPEDRPIFDEALRQIAIWRAQQGAK